MGRTPIYRTSNELEQHLNIERTQKCSSIGDQTQTANLYVALNERTSNIELIGPSLDLLD